MNQGGGKTSVGVVRLFGLLKSYILALVEDLDAVIGELRFGLAGRFVSIGLMPSF